MHRLNMPIYRPSISLGIMGMNLNSLVVVNHGEGGRRGSFSWKLILPVVSLLKWQYLYDHLSIFRIIAQYRYIIVSKMREKC